MSDQFYLPLFHKLAGCPCLVVGGGKTALRKIRWLLRAQAKITVVSPKLCDPLRELVDAGSITYLERPFQETDITTELWVLVISATNDPDVNRTVYHAAQAANVLVNCVDQPELCTFIFPAIVDRSPILIAISSMGSAPTLARIVRGWIEQWLSPNLGNLATLAKGLRDEVKAALPSVDARKNFWEDLFRSQVAEDAIQGRMPVAVQGARDQLHNAKPIAGRVALVGAGPGDPELITLKALKLIQRADVILYDKLANPQLLDYARRDAECIYVGKQGPKPGSLPTRPDNRSNQQTDINTLMVDHAQSGGLVVRLKGGDPFIYGRGGEEVESAVAAGLDITVVPGITAALGAASYAGIPLTYRNISQSVRFVTGHRVENAVNLDWPEFARPEQTLVIYMGLVGLATILDRMMTHGCEAERPAALIENATLAEQRAVYGTVSNLAELAHSAKIEGPSVVIIGEVVGLAAQYAEATQA